MVEKKTKKQTCNRHKRELNELDPNLPGAQLWSKNLLTLYSSPRQSGVIVRVAKRRPMGMFQP